MSDKRQHTCSNCGAWQPPLTDYSGELGECRRHAPRPSKDGDKYAFPAMNAEEWCWEHVLPPVQQTFEVRTPAAGAGGGAAPEPEAKGT